MNIKAYNKKKKKKDFHAYLPFENLRRMDKVKFSIEPNNQTLQKGLNIKFRCTNEECEGKNGFWFSPGFNTFHIEKLVYKSFCPHCNSQKLLYSPLDIVFFECKYLVEALSTSNHELNLQNYVKDFYYSHLDRDSWHFMSITTFQ